MRSVAYHRRWYWKFLATAYLCSFSAGWLAIAGRYIVALALFITGIALALVAGMHAGQAKREEKWRDSRERTRP